MGSGGLCAQSAVGSAEPSRLLGQPRREHRAHQGLRLPVVGLALHLEVDLVHAPGLVHRLIDVLGQRSVILAEGERTHRKR